ncbi:MAG: hypothetical protein AB7W16_12595 [Candidatus Obscuribacterales bacterium]
MALSTLLVCENEEKAAQIATLIGGNSDMQLVGTTARESAESEIESKHPRIVWIELSSDPDTGLSLLSGLKEHHPEIHFLVSNETLEADLVKDSMHLGAVDFLDAKTWQDQLPDVMSRVVAKEISHQQARAKLDAQREQMRQMLEAQRTSNPPANVDAIKAVRKKSIEMDEYSSANTMMLAVILVLVICGALFYFMMPK